MSAMIIRHIFFYAGKRSTFRSAYYTVQGRKFDGVYYTGTRTRFVVSTKN